MLDQHMDQDVQGESEKEGPKPPHSEDGLDEGQSQIKRNAKLMKQQEDEGYKDRVLNTLKNCYDVHVDSNIKPSLVHLRRIQEREE